MKTLGDVHELRDGIRWLIRLRMVATLGVVIAAFVADRQLKMNLYYPGLYATAFFLQAYNIAFGVVLHNSKQIKTLRALANGQIFLDFLSLTVLLHFSGGIENPFTLYFIFHAIISAILLTRWEAVLQTALASVMIVLLFLGEQHGILHHWDLGLLPETAGAQPALFAVSKLLVLISTLVLALYMTISISERSRRKNEELSSIRERLTRHELPRGEEEILREEKLTSLGKIAAGIAHEINNPLTVILTNVELMLEDVDSKNPLHESLHIVRDEVIRCRNIISQLLTFAGGGEAGRKLCDAGAVMKRAATLIQNYAALNQVRINFNLPPEPVHCRVNENQIVQLLFNVMLNGIQAMRKGGVLNLGVGPGKDHCVKFTVEDSGHGIPKSMLARVFEPFFSTKKSGEGTGLGLFVCHRIVELHHGVINVESEENKGTRVTIRLSCA